MYCRFASWRLMNGHVRVCTMMIVVGKCKQPHRMAAIYERLLRSEEAAAHGLRARRFVGASE